MPLIALAVVAGAAYTASEARKARRDAEREQAAALQQQSKDAELMRARIAEQSQIYSRQAGALEEQARIAKDQLATAQEALSQNVKSYETGLSQYQQARLEMEQKARETQAAIDEQRRKAAETEATQLRARTRGGRRMLLSQERLNPELGIENPSLGTGLGIG
jgi:chromosome segregation ATPase